MWSIQGICISADIGCVKEYSFRGLKYFEDGKTGVCTVTLPTSLTESIEVGKGRDRSAAKSAAAIVVKMVRLQRQLQSLLIETGPKWTPIPESPVIPAPQKRATRKTKVKLRAVD